MKKALYYLAIIASFILVYDIGSLICAALCIRGIFGMIIIVTLAYSASKLTAALLKDKLNPATKTADDGSS